MPNKINEKIPLLILSVIIAALTALNIIWIKLNQIPPFYDNAGHTDLAYIYAHIFRETFPMKNPIDFFKVSTFYPPLLHIIGGLIISISGFYYKNLQYFSSFFLGASAIFLYLYINYLTKNKWCGFFSAVFFIFFPHVWEESRYFMLDLPLTFFILASLYFLEKSQGFKNSKFTGLFFLLAALAQLTKWYAFVYIAVPFIFKLSKSIKDTVNLKKTFLKLTLYTIIAGLLILPWYLINLKDILFWTSIFTNPDYGDPVITLSLKNFSYYLILLINYQVVSLQFFWFIIACFFVLKSKTNLKIYLFLQIVAIYLIFTFFIGNKNLRYLMPLLPFFASVMGYGMYLVIKKSKLYGAAIFGVLFSFNFLLFTVNSFGIPFNSNTLITKQLNKNIDSIYLLDMSSRAVSYKQESSIWSPKIVVDDLSDLTNQNDAKILVLADNPNTSVAGLRIFSIEDKNYLHFNDVPFDIFKKIKTPDQIKSFIKNADYIILPDQIVAPIGQFNYKNLEAIREYILSGHTREYALIKEYNLPNKDILYLLKKNATYNILSINLIKNVLFVERKPAIANIYFQFLDNNNNWTQETLLQHGTLYSKNLTNIKTFRIDYPPSLMNTVSDNDWTYNGEKQFDKKN